MKQRTGRKLRRTSSGLSHCTSLSPHRCQRRRALNVLLPLFALVQSRVVFLQGELRLSVTCRKYAWPGGGGTWVHHSVKGVLLLGALKS